MEYLKIYEEWLNNPYFDEETKDELLSIKGDEKEIEDRFYKDLEFGTAGLRGVIGSGTNRMNKYTIRRVSFALANYIIKKTGEEGKKRGVVIAHDNRHKSREFCLETAKTLSACGIKTYIFDELRATPQLSFALRYLNAISGVVITASHNPPEYNGYKVYWEDGAQILPHIAKEIIEEVNKIDDYSKIPTIDEKEAMDKGFINLLDEKVDTAFIEAVKEKSLRSDIIEKVADNFKIVFTPLHGTGNKPIRRALREIGFKNVLVVKEQENPDPNFSTVKYPNPEEKEALKLGIELAKREKANLVIGTDPDCDRVGVAVKNNEGEYICLTGNQVGALLTNYILENLSKENKLPKNGVVIKTIVTSEFGSEIARSYNIDVLDTLTGFKFIGEKIKEFEETKDKTYIFGYEESYGYLCGTHARDKDGVVAAMLISEMAAYYYSKDMSLYEGLIELYEKYGYYKEDLKSITLKGKEGQEKINKVIKYFRENKIEEVNNIKVKEFKDYKKGIDNLPKADVLKFILEDNSWFAIRPSGTEPKIKFYFASVGKSKEDVESNLNNLVSSIMEKVEKI
ncbi:phospho-sugar mutase [Tepidibacter formicigenes]|jgi:phosphoglucomutase|uniref:phosphoglucomutase (alpha-D-glucose-1,6-bisphosphate-dependent) n=1 Tax=Tepidibacter formicigenes DSM 15518 TaxID=1123349 RepID=A0A1M6TE74_9FIRM|nr:phospho-sugar mutase [Tepidibacter formicigenes]SHK55270.1 phosphoglucomutase [Tepidibacter formicigenes DSM 15518]